MSTYLVVSNETQNRVVVAKHGEAYTPDARIILEPKGSQNAVVVVKSGDWKDNPDLLKLIDGGLVAVKESDKPTVKQPYAPRDSELPSDKWQRVGIEDLVKGTDERFKSLIELDTRGEEGVSDGMARQYMRTEYLEILQAAAKWLENPQMPDTPQNQERLAAIQKRIAEVREI